MNLFLATVLTLFPSDDLPPLGNLYLEVKGAEIIGFEITDHRFIPVQVVSIDERTYIQFEWDSDLPPMGPVMIFYLSGT